MRNNATIRQRATLLVPVRLDVSWTAVYVSATIVAWTISPFLRRLADWKTHFSAISPFAALPMVMLVPAVAMLFAGRVRRINKSLELVAVLWMLGFSYALVVAVLVGHLLGGIYTFVSFCLPLGFAIWIATRVEDAELWYRRISLTVIVMAVVTGVYGFIQYVSPPPWDVAWMNSVDMPSIGYPQPFKVRVFSMLNAPAALAGFLTVGTVFFLPRLTLKTGFLLLPIFVGLGLTSVRAGWITLPLSIVVFAFLTTRRATLLKGVATFIGVGVLGIALLQPLLSIGVGGSLQNRLATLGNVVNDPSAQDRLGQISHAFDLGVQNPQGNGLGFVGVGTRLNSAQGNATEIDSGFLARFVEMGFPGTFAFLASTGIALFAAIRVWKVAVRNGDGGTQDLAAMAISMQICLLALNFFGDASTGLGALLSWTSLALILRSPVPKRPLY